MRSDEPDRPVPRDSPAPSADEARATGCCIVIASPDMTSGEQVRELFERGRRMLIRRPAHVEIDLRCVTAADTKLIACLVALYRIAREAPVHLEVRLSNAVQDVARMCRLERLIEELAV